MVDLGCIFPRVMEIPNNIHIMVDGPVVFGLLLQCVDSQTDLGTDGKRLGQLWLDKDTRKQFTVCFKDFSRRVQLVVSLLSL